MDSPAHVDGAVAAFLVATAPGKGATPRELLWRPVLGRPLVAWPLRALARLDHLDSCSLVVPYTRYADGEYVIRDLPPASHCRVIGIDEAPWSFTLHALVHSSRVRKDWVILVDAALPLVSTESLRAGLRAARQTGVAIAAEPVKETLKRVEGQRVVETLPREHLRCLAATIIFHRDALRRVLRWFRDQPTTTADFVDVAQMAGLPLATFAVDYPCVRVTSEHDLAIVESLLRQRESERSSP